MHDAGKPTPGEAMPALLRRFPPLGALPIASRVRFLFLVTHLPSHSARRPQSPTPRAPPVAISATLGRACGGCLCSVPPSPAPHPPRAVAPVPSETTAVRLGPCPPREAMPTTRGRRPFGTTPFLASAGQCPPSPSKELAPTQLGLTPSTATRPTRHSDSSPRLRASQRTPAEGALALSFVGWLHTPHFIAERPLLSARDCAS